MPTLLIVDDSALVRHAVASRLRVEGFDVRAEATLAGARTVDLTTIACAAVDIDLPDGSGLDLAAELLAKHPSLPVAFFTASTAPPEGHSPVFHKPDVEGLVAWVLSAGSSQPPPTK